MKRATAVAVMVVLMAAGLSQAQGAALTAARDTPSRTGNFVSLGVYTNTRIFAGSMVAINSSGYAVAASDATTLNVIGAATETVDNRTNAEGAGDSGAKTIEIARGVFRWVNGDTFTDADIGDLAFVEDDQTVQKAASATYDIIAGVILDVDSDGVWVDTYDIGAQGASAPTTLAVTDTATIGGTLGVTGVGTFTAESVHNGGIDTDYVTTDAAAGVDTKTAGTLMIGESTATKVEIADTGVETEVQGELDVLGTSIALEGSKTAGTGYFQIDTNGTGANTNALFSLGNFTIGDDGDGTLIETNTAAAAEYCIGILIGGARYNILLEKP